MHQKRIRVGLPGLKKTLERAKSFVLRRKVPYEAARSCPAEFSRSLRRVRQMSVGTPKQVLLRYLRGPVSHKRLALGV